ncbi:MAG: arylamine N-acetyltransferase [Acidimicrobiia bacterium]|nr:arylamine N-acetyltransferase [Acidimicrobiia bacterium]
MDLNQDAIAAYLGRIGFSGPVHTDLETLSSLQSAHMTAVPFENLHVFHGRGVSTAAEWSIPKVVEQGRGGWCFELNGAFSTLLEALGFEVTRLAAGVLLNDGVPPPMPDHLTLRVDLDEPYLVDVGFGDSFISPLLLNLDAAQDGGDTAYRLRSDGEFRILERASDDGWAPQYRFTLEEHKLADFTDRSDFLQATPSEHWTEAPFATRLIDGGPDRVWLLRNRIKLRRDGQVSVTAVPADRWAETLHDWFGMTP